MSPGIFSGTLLYFQTFVLVEKYACKETEVNVFFKVKSLWIKNLFIHFGNSLETGVKV